MSRAHQIKKSLFLPIALELMFAVVRKATMATKFSAPNTSSITSRTWCRLSSLICTKTDPDGARSSRARRRRSRR